ncbi:hypothetical protein R6Z07M_004949 [Ovis aries]
MCGLHRESLLPFSSFLHPGLSREVYHFEEIKNAEETLNFLLDTIQIPEVTQRDYSQTQLCARALDGCLGAEHSLCSRAREPGEKRSASFHGGGQCVAHGVAQEVGNPLQHPGQIRSEQRPVCGNCGGAVSCHPCPQPSSQVL